jgi:adenylate cyclase
MLNDYLSVLVTALFEHDGTVDRFVGDAILAVFGSPEPDPHQHENAVRAAAKMQSAVQALNERRRGRGLVNLASGYCDAAKALEVLISQTIHQRVWRIVNAVPRSISTKT